MTEEKKISPEKSKKDDKIKEVNLSDPKKEEGVSKKKSNLLVIIIAIVVVALLGLLAAKFHNGKNTLGLEEAKNKAENFINDNLMLPGTKAFITSIEKEYDLYKITVDVGDGELIESYISRDGELFFPQALEIDDFTNMVDDFIEADEVSNKQDRLNIELFTMSHCPYGTQMERGLIPVLELLEDHIDFELKFNSYAMHDKEELDEQLTQYCLQKEDKAKLLPYLSCFNDSGDSSTCLSSLGVNKSKINSCIQSTDQEYKISENYENPETWMEGMYPSFPIYEEDNDNYGVLGSPTLIINGDLVSSARDPQSLLELACSGFINPPSECESELSDIVPDYGIKQ